MKKIILFLSFVFLLSGCMKYNDKDLVNEVSKKISNSNSYKLNATLEIFRNEEKFAYDVTSFYQKEDNFMVKLINKENNHEQIILKNKEAVYVLTPSLNKSFKFQSDWPYNNSQIYLLQPIIKDIEKDNKRIFEKVEDGYIITSNVNYSSERTFEKQKVYFDKKKNISKIDVLDSQNSIKMNLKVISIEYNIKLDEDFFNIEKYQKSIKNQEEDETNKSNKKNDEKTNLNLEEIIYPMYVPTETYLTSQDVVETETGERVILTFSGESQFIVIQENTSKTSDESYVYGDPYLILDTVGSITDSSVSWISNGVEYSVISDTMSIDDLLTVAQSISVEPISK